MAVDPDFLQNVFAQPVAARIDIDKVWGEKNICTTIVLVISLQIILVMVFCSRLNACYVILIWYFIVYLTMYINSCKFKFTQ